MAKILQINYLLIISSDYYSKLTKKKTYIFLKQNRLKNILKLHFKKFQNLI